MYLKEIRFNSSDKNYYPYNLPVFKDLVSINFSKNVTILVGENGTGKSTLLESISLCANLPTIGYNENDYDESIVQFSNDIQLIWNIRKRTGFFLNSENFIGFIKRISIFRKEAIDNLNDIEIRYKNRSSFSKTMASLPYKRTLSELQELYAEGLEYKSHGESYLEFFKKRFHPSGLYILDEPEVPLSPMKQLALISMITELANNNTQFIIATHSPILMAIPDAEILSFDVSPPSIIPYNELEHVKITKSFLDNPERFLKYL